MMASWSKIIHFYKARLLETTFDRFLLLYKSTKWIFCQLTGKNSVQLNLKHFNVNVTSSHCAEPAFVPFFLLKIARAAWHEFECKWTLQSDSVFAQIGHSRCLFWMKIKTMWRSSWTLTVVSSRSLVAWEAKGRKSQTLVWRTRRQRSCEENKPEKQENQARLASYLTSPTWRNVRYMNWRKAGIQGIHDT